MSTFKRPWFTRAANAVGKTSRRGPVTEILLIGYNKKKRQSHQQERHRLAGARPDCWRWGGDTNLTLAHWMREEGWQRGPLPVTVWWQRVLGEGRGGAAALIGLCWSRPAPPPGGWPGFSPAALVPGGWLTWSCRRERGQKRSFLCSLWLNICFCRYLKWSRFCRPYKSLRSWKLLTSPLFISK